MQYMNYGQHIHKTNVPGTPARMDIMSAIDCLHATIHLLHAIIQFQIIHIQLRAVQKKQIVVVKVMWVILIFS